MRAAAFLATVAFACLLGSTSLRAGENWPMYGRNLSHTFSNSDSQINTDNVASLKPLWKFLTSDAVSASPTVVGSVVGGPASIVNDEHDHKITTHRSVGPSLQLH
jgi:hypothetical protein